MFLPFNVATEVISLFMVFSYLTQYLPDLLFYNKQVVHVRNIEEFKENSTHYPIINFVGLVEQHGYTGEEYVLTTEDGYIVTLHRISGSPKSPKAPGKPVVYIQHGILLSSDSWVLIGPEKDLPFLLADAGKDVWLGNARGNTYSRTNVNKTLPKENLWKFSYHEMAKYDMKTYVDFILENTGEKQMTYIGYSMGGTIGYVFLSMYPEYNQKFRHVHSFAPAVFWENELRRVSATVQKNFEFIAKLVKVFNIVEVFPQTAFVAKNGARFCSNGNYTQDFCAKLVSTIGLDVNRVNKTALPTILAHFPAGTSMTNVFHYHDNINGFKAYNYGPDENMKRYGQETPPAYDLKKVTTPVSLWYAKNDEIMNDKDILLLKERLPNVVSYNEIQHVDFNHFDFLWAQDVKELVYDRVINEL